MLKKRLLGTGLILLLTIGTILWMQTRKSDAQCIVAPAGLELGQALTTDTNKACPNGVTLGGGSGDIVTYNGRVGLMFDGYYRYDYDLSWIHYGAVYYGGSDWTACWVLDSHHESG